MSELSQKQRAARNVPLVLTWAVLLLTAAACDNPTASGGGPAQSANAASEAASANAAAETAVTATPSATAAGPKNPHAGRWSGSYKAAKAEVTVPEGVDYKSWSKDSGTEAVGDGKVTLRVAADGRISGEADGALGKQQISGQLEEKQLRATVQADAVDTGMSGILKGNVAGDNIKAIMRVSDGQGNLVREAPVTLSRSKSE